MGEVSKRPSNRLMRLQENGVIPGTDRRQLSTLKASLPGYTWLGAGRPTPLGVRTSAFTVLDHEWVRLSTAGVGGATGDRFALVATLRATSDGTKFLAINLESDRLVAHQPLRGACAGCAGHRRASSDRSAEGRAVAWMMCSMARSFAASSFSSWMSRSAPRSRENSTGCRKNSRSWLLASD